MRLQIIDQEALITCSFFIYLYNLQTDWTLERINMSPDSSQLATKLCAERVQPKGVLLPSPGNKLEFYVRWVSLKEISCYPWGTWHRGISCDLRGTRHEWSRVGEQRTPHTIPACTSMHQASCIQVKYHMYVSAKLFSSCKGPSSNSAIH